MGQKSPFLSKHCCEIFLTKKTTKLRRAAFFCQIYNCKEVLFNLRVLTFLAQDEQLAGSYKSITCTLYGRALFFYTIRTYNSITYAEADVHVRYECAVITIEGHGGRVDDDSELGLF